MHARLKCCDDRFAANPQYVFHSLDCIKRNAVASSIHFAERKQFQSEISLGQLVNHNNVKRLISADQIFSSFKILLSTFTIFFWLSLPKLGSLEHILFLDLLCSRIPLDGNNLGCCFLILTNINWWTSKCNGLEYKGKLFEKKSSCCSKANWLWIQVFIEQSSNFELWWPKGVPK